MENYLPFTYMSWKIISLLLTSHGKFFLLPVGLLNDGRSEENLQMWICQELMYHSEKNNNKWLSLFTFIYKQIFNIKFLIKSISSLVHFTIWNMCTISSSNFDSYIMWFNNKKYVKSNILHFIISEHQLDCDSFNLIFNYNMSQSIMIKCHLKLAPIATFQV